MGRTLGQRGTGLTVGAVLTTARYPRTAKFLQFGGRFDSEGVALARIHIPQLSWAALWCGFGACPGGQKWRFDEVAGLRLDRRCGRFGALCVRNMLCQLLLLPVQVTGWTGFLVDLRSAKVESRWVAAVVE